MRHPNTDQELSREAFWRCEAAEGWLLLANPSEALAELDGLPADQSGHTSVLAIEWRAATAAGRHDRAWVAAKRLCQAQPKCAGAWICQANSLRELRGPQAAADLLLCVIDRFSHDAVMQYNL